MRYQLLNWQKEKIHATTMLLAMFMALHVLAAGTPKASIILITPASQTVVSQLNEAQKQYLALPRAERIALFADGKERRKLVKEAGYHPVPITFSWRWDGEQPECFQLHISLDKRFANEQVQVVQTNTTTADSLFINTRYYWKVTATNADGRGISSGVQSFWTADETPRLITIRGVPNVRDLGGYKTLDGKRVKQGLLFRSAGLNGNASTVRPKPTEEDPQPVGTQVPGRIRLDNATREHVLKTYGIKTDIDLRRHSECFGMTGSPLGPSVAWEHISSLSYAAIVSKTGQAAFAQSFRLLCDTNNYPVIFHCIAGQDRTGSLAFILNGLLGVAEEDLYKDWEISGFWNPYPGFSHKHLFDKLVAAFEANYPQPTWREKMEAYVIAAGFTQKDIEKFRAIMLEP